jgi:hypothetical protein
MTYIITNESITVVANGQSYTLSATHGNFNAVLDAIRAGAPEAEVIELINPRIALTKYLGGAFEVSCSAYPRMPSQRIATRPVASVLRELGTERQSSCPHRAVHIPCPRTYADHPRRVLLGIQVPA